MSLPAADDLFRPTATPAASSPAPSTAASSAPEEPPTGASEQAPEQPENAGKREVGAGAGDRPRGRGKGRQPSGRVRHDEKMTVYVTAEELLDLEHARLLLRRDHGLAVDRGRIVRAAVALALADLDAHGEDSALVQRLEQA